MADLCFLMPPSFRAHAESFSYLKQIRHQLRIICNNIGESNEITPKIVQYIKQREAANL